MKKLFFFLSLVGLSLVFTNCNKDDDEEEAGEDLTVEIVGDYTGAYGSNTVATINPYEIVVSKVNNSKVSIRPKSGTEFNEIEVDILRVNSSSLSSDNSNNQQLDRNIIFVVGIPVTINVTIDPTGDAHSFVGSML